MRPASGALFLHPSGSFPEGVSSSLFKLQPRATPTTYPQQSSPSGAGADAGTGGGEVAVTAPAALDVRLVEETDLAEISALLAEVRKVNVPTRKLWMPYHARYKVFFLFLRFFSTHPSSNIT